MDSFAKIDPKLIDSPPPRDRDGHSGYPAHLAAGDTRDVLLQVVGNASRAFPSSMWIEPNLWWEKARENDEFNTWGMNYLDRYTNQTPTHECTCHSLRANVEACRNRQRGIIFPNGPKANFRYEESAKYGSVWLAPNSIYPEANPRQWGGAGVRQVLEIACRRGMLPETKQPRDYGFKHAIPGTTGRGGLNQASGPWLSLSQFPAGHEDTSAWFRPLEVIFPESFEQAVCLVLHGLLDSVGRSGHAVPWAQLIFEGKNLKAAAYPDSYDVTRYDSVATMRSAWRGSFAIASVTAPDDWNNPAGK